MRIQPMEKISATQMPRDGKGQGMAKGYGRNSWYSYGHKNQVNNWLFLWDEIHSINGVTC